MSSAKPNAEERLRQFFRRLPRAAVALAGLLIAAERPLLRALPGSRPAVACGEARKVDRLATVRFASARYSVPHRLVGRTVQVSATDRELTALHDGVPVAHHPLLGPGTAR